MSITLSGGRFGTGHGIDLVMKGGNQMDKATTDRMASLFFAMFGNDNNDELFVTDDDKDFFMNHLGSFAELMANQAVEFLTDQFSVDERAAKMVIHGTAMLHKMLGAQSFSDFLITEQLADQ
jgi:hypothetical protein